MTETTGRELVPTLVGIWILVCKTRGGARAWLYARPFAGAAHMACLVHTQDVDPKGLCVDTGYVVNLHGLREVAKRDALDRMDQSGRATGRVRA